MNKLLLIMLLSLSCGATKIQCDNNFPKQNEQAMQNAWFPPLELLPMLDHCYEDVKHPIINNGIMRSKGNLLFNLFGAFASTTQEKDMAKIYCKYLGMYLYFAEQLLFEDEEVASYVQNINWQDYADILNEETARMIEHVMPGELFILMNIFLKDIHFQQEVEQFTQMALEQFYNK